MIMTQLLLCGEFPNTEMKMLSGEFVISGCTGSCHGDDFWYGQGQQIQ